LSHSDPTTAVMYKAFAPGEVRSTLSSGDIQDVCTLYPNATGTPTPGGGSGGICSFCQDDSDCASGICVFDTSGHRWCTKNCQQSSDCGSGYVCVTTTQPNFNVC